MKNSHNFYCRLPRIQLWSDSCCQQWKGSSVSGSKTEQVGLLKKFLFCFSFCWLQHCFAPRKAGRCCPSMTPTLPKAFSVEELQISGILGNHSLFWTLTTPSVAEKIKQTKFVSVQTWHQTVVEKNDRLLARYHSPVNVPRPESYAEDYTNAQDYFSEDSARQKFYTNIASAAESGWDFSSRW